MIPISADMMLIPRGSLAWQHAFNSVTPAAVLAFQTAPATPFVIAATIGLSYTGQIASNVRDHTARGKFSSKF